MDKLVWMYHYLSDGCSRALTPAAQLHQDGNLKQPQGTLAKILPSLVQWLGMVKTRSIMVLIIADIDNYQLVIVTNDLIIYGHLWS